MITYGRKKNLGITGEMKTIKPFTHIFAKNLYKNHIKL